MELPGVPNQLLQDSGGCSIAGCASTGPGGRRVVRDQLLHQRFGRAWGVLPIWIGWWKEMQPRLLQNWFDVVGRLPNGSAGVRKFWHRFAST